MGLALIRALRRISRKTVVLILHGLGTRKRIDILFESINLNSTEIFTYESHAHDLQGLPFFNSAPNIVGSSIVRAPSTTIVMQGPIDQRSNFTMRSVRHYLNSYPNINLVLSTWENEDLAVFSEVLENPLLESRFRIIQSQKPRYAGVSNVNLQIVSTQAGIRYARKEPTKYLLKTRTDQCLFSRLSLQYMESLVDMYPSSDGSSRILSCSQSTFLLRPYGLSDMVTFGKFESVSKYWDVELDERQMVDLPFLDVKTLRHEAVNSVCEIYLAKKYLESKGIQPDNTLLQSLEAYRDHFLIADNQVLDLIWNKYSYRKNKYSRLNSPIRHQELNHFLWQNLQSNLDSFLFLEFLLDKEGNF